MSTEKNSLSIKDIYQYSDIVRIGTVEYIVSGGLDSGIKSSNKVFKLRFSVDGQNWKFTGSEFFSLQEDRCCHKSLFYNNKIYFFGGASYQNKVNILNSLECYDLNTK